jgi:hypothetical protein
MALKSFKTYLKEQQEIQEVAPLAAAIPVLASAAARMGGAALARMAGSSIARGGSALASRAGALGKNFRVPGPRPVPRSPGPRGPTPVPGPTKGGGLLKNLATNALLMRIMRGSPNGDQKDEDPKVENPDKPKEIQIVGMQPSEVVTSSRPVPQAPAGQGSVQGTNRAILPYDRMLRGY